MSTAEKIEDATIRERAVLELEQQISGINEAFEHNELDYGRKLYLIENCIYGVDIQPIAVQIAKMRFFISLIVDQKIDDTQPNRGVRPLPNLETKFVAANTLIGINRPGQQLLRNRDIDAKEAELRRVRERHFLARTPKQKAKCREDDAKLRVEIAELLKSDGWDTATARKLASWNPYDQNASADFFDPEWMFGLTEGFDVSVGNPPYVDSEQMVRTSPELVYYVFDLLNFDGRDTTRLPIEQRKELLEITLKDAPDRIKLLQGLDTLPVEALDKVRDFGLEGIVCKRAGSIYESGLRTGAWLKYRIGLEQEFVVGGYKHPEGVTGTIESLLVGYYEGGKLMYAGKVKSGFPEAELLRKFRRMVRPKCPFVNLPTGSSGRWGFGVDAEEMKRCVWVQPKLVCQVAFAEWTRGDQLRHTSFKGMRHDKDPKEIVREQKAFN